MFRLSSLNLLIHYTSYNLFHFFLVKILMESTIIFLGDFAANYPFVVQDEVQSFHWKNMMCTLHPLPSSHLSYTIISDDNTHDVDFIYLVITDVSEKLPNINTVQIFTHGCAGQYKNHKTFFSLCQLEHECGIFLQHRM